MPRTGNAMNTCSVLLKFLVIVNTSLTDVREFCCFRRWWAFFLFCFVVDFEVGSYCSSGWPGASVCRPNWPGTQRFTYLCFMSAGLKMCAVVVKYKK